MDRQSRYNTIERSRRRFGVLELLIAALVILLGVLGYWLAADGVRAAMASRGFQYVGLAAIVVALGVATRVTARLVENGTIVDRPSNTLK
jgi:hypothetical protein